MLATAIRTTGLALVLLALASCGGGGGMPPMAAGDAPSPSAGPPITTAAPCDLDTPPAAVLVAGARLTRDIDPPQPAARQGVIEADFGTCVLRVTDHRADRLDTFARNDYSRRQAFNADDSRQLVYALDGHWHLYDDRLRHVGRLPHLQADAEPQWHPTDPDLLFYLPVNGIGMRIHQLRISTGQSTPVGDLAARLRQRWPTAMSAWTRSEGSPSADGRYWCFLVDDPGWQGLGLVTWDRLTDTVLGMADLGGDRPDHVSMSPSGNYCVASHYSATGVVVFDRDLTRRRTIATLGEHSDIGLDGAGDDIYLSIDYQADDGAVYMINLRTGIRQDLFRTYIDGTGSAMHFSAKAFGRPGWFVLSTYGGGSQRPPYAPQWFHRRIMVIAMRANPVIYLLASTHARDAGYWAEPQASVNRDLTRITWTSNWNRPSETDLEVYQLRLAPGAIGR